VVIIVGTLYAGEIKKSLFSIMNYLLPEKGILPMHSGANRGPEGSAVFFGLSGTGKTTLSTDEGRKLIGDDEHGLSDQGVFNFEGGCYAKTIRLNVEAEPGIYHASTRFGAMLENVVMNPETRQVDFDDASITENGRSSYPLSFIDGVEPSHNGPVPKNMFFLSADAFGVLPPVAKLTPAQAMFYFVLGYTAKLAGTEIGVKEPQATFSPCFGAPFMMRHPSVYARLLEQYMTKHNISVWLINTGWANGPYGVGQRFPIKVTRSIIRQVQDGTLDKIPSEKDPIFGFAIPQHVEGVDRKTLNPSLSWPDSKAYQKKAQELAKMFHTQMKTFGDFYHHNRSGAPIFE
jgi:phosphoenolpyruvate carboxykinase (ATP)